jgi:hypothetical protein
MGMVALFLELCHPQAPLEAATQDLRKAICFFPTLAAKRLDG